MSSIVLSRYLSAKDGENSIIGRVCRAVRDAGGGACSLDIFTKAMESWYLNKNRETMKSLSHLSMGRSRRHWRASCSRTVTPARLTVTWFFYFSQSCFKLLKISFLYFLYCSFFIRDTPHLNSWQFLFKSFCRGQNRLDCVRSHLVISFYQGTWSYLLIRILVQFNLYNFPFLVSWLLISFLNTNHQLLFAVTSSPESEVTGQVPRYFTCIINLLAGTIDCVCSSLAYISHRYCKRS